MDDNNKTKRRKLSSDDGDVCYLDGVPNDILGEILKYFNDQGKDKLSVRMINKRFLNICKLVHDPTIKNNLPLKHASRNGYYKIVEELLKDPRVDPSANDNYSIRYMHLQMDI